MIKNLVGFFLRHMVSTMEDEVIANVSIILLCAMIQIGASSWRIYAYNMFI